MGDCTPHEVLSLAVARLCGGPFRSYLPSEEIVDDLKQHVRTSLSLHAYPREIEFVSELPKTPSGKVQRNVLREREWQG